MQYIYGDGRYITDEIVLAGTLAEWALEIRGNAYGDGWTVVSARAITDDGEIDFAPGTARWAGIIRDIHRNHRLCRLISEHVAEEIV